MDTKKKGAGWGRGVNLAWIGYKYDAIVNIIIFSSSSKHFANIQFNWSILHCPKTLGSKALLLDSTLYKT
jgi:hypothetical protein